MEFNIKKECKVTKNPIKNIGLPKGALIGGVVRHNQGLIPTGEFTIQVGDRVIVFSKVGCSQKTSRYFR
jgi:trk system potassium uptake protein TrkA